jgi:hypothetical protein
LSSRAYTNSQSLTDQPMKDRRDSRAAAENIIPSSSNAARALRFIWKDLKITGEALDILHKTFHTGPSFVTVPHSGGPSMPLRTGTLFSGRLTPFGSERGRRAEAEFHTNV